MKLSIERIEEQKGFISKKSVYIIVVDLNFSDEEKALITVLRRFHCDFSLHSVLMFNLPQ